jgi:hypothetical protein
MHTAAQRIIAAAKRCASLHCRRSHVERLLNSACPMGLANPPHIMHHASNSSDHKHTSHLTSSTDHANRYYGSTSNGSWDCQAHAQAGVHVCSTSSSCAASTHPNTGNQQCNWHQATLQATLHVLSRQPATTYKCKFAIVGRAKTEREQVMHGTTSC